MRKINKFLLICTLLIASLILFSCGPKGPKLVDYVSQLKLDKSPEGSTFVTNGLGEVKLYNSVDGDTAWFTEGKDEIKVRFCSVDTPESTGKIEAWGLKASNFTKEKLTNAESIILQSENGEAPQIDSTGTRYVGFVWYKNKGEADYRLLNLELVQEGLSKNKSTKGSLYLDLFEKAGNQSLKNKLYVYSDAKDPDYDYSNGTEVSLKEINTNGSQYFYKRVYFEALITRKYENYVYAQQKDADGKNYGVLVYLGYESTLQDKLSPLKPGNIVRISGFVQEHNGVYQISGLSYNAFNDADASKTGKLDEAKLNKYPTYCHTVKKNQEVTPEVLEKSSDLTNNGAQLMRTLVQLKDLRVVRVTSKNEAVGDQVAKEMTIICKDAYNNEVQLRTGTLYFDKKPITENDFMGKRIVSINGIVDNFKGTYQLRIVTWEDVVIQ